MISQFDVFEILEDGQVMWHRAAADLAEAQAIARQQAAQSKNKFFVLNQTTRQKLFVDSDGLRDESAGPASASGNSAAPSA